MDPGQRRKAYIAGCLSLVHRPLQGGSASAVVPGLALCSTKTRELVRLRLLKTQASRCFGCAVEVEDGVGEPVLDPGEFAEHGVAADLQPQVFELAHPALDVAGSLD